MDSHSSNCGFEEDSRYMQQQQQQEEEDGEEDDRREQEEEEEEEEEGERSKSLLGFLFGNVNDSGGLDEEYLDQDAKEHLLALADKLGQSLVDIDLSVGRERSSLTTEGGEQEDYKRKADDAVDYEGIEEQYEGPEDYMQTEIAIAKDQHFFAQAALATPSWKASTFALEEEENYDEDDGDNESEAKVEDGSESHLTGEGQNLPPVIGVIDEDTADHFSHEDLNKAEKEEEEADSLSPEVTKAFHALPVLCIEDGKEVLKFSEIFGHQERSWVLKSERGQHQRFILKGKTGEVDVQVLEDDDEALLKSLTIDYNFRDDHFDTSDKKDSEEDSEEDKEEKVGTTSKQMQNEARERASHWVCALPMKEESGEWDDIFGESRRVPSPNLNLIHLDDWEKGIIWDSDLRYVRADAIDIAKDFSSSNLEEEHDGDVRETSDMLVENELVLSSRVKERVEYHIERLTGASLPLSSGKTERMSRHPQMLRLEAKADIISNLESNDRSNDSRLIEIRRKLGNLMYQNMDLSSGSWVNQILWDGISNGHNENSAFSTIIFDLQDERMVFEIPDTKDGQQYRAHASAMVIAPCLKRSMPDGPGGDLSSIGFPSSACFNISNDKYYMNKKAPQQHKSNTNKKRAVHGIKVMHSLPAIKLQTLKPKLANKDLANFHRPKAVWYPHHNKVAAKEQGSVYVKGPMKVILKTMGGKGNKLHVDASETVESVKAKACKKFGDFKSLEKTKIFYSGKELEESRTLAQQGVPANSVLHLVRTRVYAWPRAQRLPGENKPVHPPGAFKKKSDLSVKDGHVALMEYCEERPLLLGNVGMGACLSTYYRKITSTDSTAAMLRNEKGPWIGVPLPLEPLDESPFLGNIRSGEMQSCIETNMYRAPIFKHKVPSTDYLLVRSSKGEISLRRIDSLHVVGQQEPHIEVFTPGSKIVHNHLGNRLLVYMYREFRDNEKPGSNPRVRYDVVTAHFPTLSEGYMRKRLKHAADLQRDKNGELWWILRKNFRIPSEEELRTIVTPENVCTYESMQAGLYHLKRMGVNKLTQPSGISAAMSQLPDEAIALAAASHIERELQITPWNLSCNFVAATLQGRGSIERLEITGAGDPSGRGLCFSYLRVPVRAPGTGAIVQKKAAAARGGGAVTGTDADLRRLSMEAAREVLLKFKVPEEQIDKLTRWHRIALVRRLSSEQAVQGDTTGVSVLNKFARGQRMSFLQLQQQAREKCQEIWDRQVQSLMAIDGDMSDTEVEGNGDLDSFAGDLENLLEAEGEDKEVTSGAGKKEIVKGIGACRRALEVQREEEIEDEEAEAAELRRMLQEDDEVAEEKKKKKNVATGKDKRFPGEKLKIPTRNVDDSFVNGAAKKNKGIRGLVRSKKSDGSYNSKEIHIRDPKEIAQYLARKNTSQNGLTAKDANKSFLIAQKEEKGVDAKDSNSVVKEKKMEAPNKLMKKGKGARYGLKVVCGACGMIGHMRTNRKVCPMYRDDGDVNKQAKEPANIEDLGEKEADKLTVEDGNHVLDQHMNQDAREGMPNEHKQVKKPSLKIKLPVVDHVESGPGSSTKVKVLTPDPEVESYDTQRYEIPKNVEMGTTKFKIKKSNLQRKIITEQLTMDKEIFTAAEDDSGNDASPSENVGRVSGKIIHGKNWQSADVGMVRKDREHAKMYKKIKYKENLMRKKREDESRRWEKRRKDKRGLKEQEEERQRDEERQREEQRQREEERQKEEFERQRLDMERELVRQAKVQRREYRERQLEIERQREKQEREFRRRREHQRFQEQQGVNGMSKSQRSISLDQKPLDKDRVYSGKRRISAELGSSQVSSEYQHQPKRRKSGEVMLSNILQNVVDALKKRRDIAYLFLKPVSKKEAPDYLDIIRNPMDLATIRDKAGKQAYKSRVQFRQDILQIAKNAHIYNDNRNPGIPPLADSLLELCDCVLHERDAELKEAESAIGTPQQQKQQQQGYNHISLSPPLLIGRRTKRYR